MDLSTNMMCPLQLCGIYLFVLCRGSMSVVFCWAVWDSRKRWNLVTFQLVEHFLFFQTCTDCFHTWLGADHIASQNNTRCEPCDDVFFLRTLICVFVMHPDEERYSIFTCTFTYCIFFFSLLSLSLLFSLRWLNGPKRKRKNSQCSVKSMTGE